MFDMWHDLWHSKQHFIGYDSESGRMSANVQKCQNQFVKIKFNLVVNTKTDREDDRNIITKICGRILCSKIGLGV